MDGEEKAGEGPNYGFVALKYFMVSLFLILIRGVLGSPWDFVVLLILAPVAFVSLWVAFSYVYLYPVLFRVGSERDWLTGIMEGWNLRGDERVLDVGCGTGRIAIEAAKLLPSGKIYGVDIFEGVSGDSPKVPRRNAEIEGVSDRVEFRNGNALDLPFENGTFDIVTMGSVLHEIHGRENEIRAVREVLRVLRPGGRFLVLELLRTWRMFVVLMIFAPVWKTEDYWMEIFRNAGAEVISVERIVKLLDVAVFIIGNSPGQNQGRRCPERPRSLGAD